jgi:hypothetical protein
MSTSESSETSKIIDYNVIKELTDLSLSEFDINYENQIEKNKIEK